MWRLTASSTPSLKLSRARSRSQVAKKKAAGRGRYVCANCGAVHVQWTGQCSDCEAWGTISEAAATAASGIEVTSLSAIDASEGERTRSVSGELERVLGGGFVPGGVVLLAGDPGIGKSTLALQATRDFKTTAYVSGEESPAQIKMRSERLGISGEGVMMISETSAEKIAHWLKAHSPDLVVLDSIQTLKSDSVMGAPGAVSQIRESAALLIQAAKEKGFPLLIIGHVTKSGDVAGPMILEHLVDVVLFMETDTSGGFRILRGLKNRFGATNEVGLFEMTGTGLIDLSDPSEIFLPSGQGEGVGSAGICSMEGRRPILIEVQALTSPTAYGLPRRLGTGVDQNRLSMLLAVLERRCDISVSRDDVYVNTAGGYRLREPSADLGILAATASSVKGVPLGANILFCGEVGLGGEIRPIPRLEDRLKEASRLGFRIAYAPAQEIDAAHGIEVRTFGKAGDLMCHLFE